MRRGEQEEEISNKNTRFLSALMEMSEVKRDMCFNIFAAVDAIYYIHEKPLLFCSTEEVSTCAKLIVCLSVYL